MIDGIKLILNENLDKIRQNRELDFTQPVSVTNGDVKINHYPEAKYKGLRFIDMNKLILVTGSIHKYTNDGLHNHNRLDFQVFAQAVKELEDTFEFDSDRTRITNLEFGVNLTTDFEPDRFIDGLIIHNGKKFSNVQSSTKRYSECSHGQYYIKIYNKGLQYGLDKNILRIELKFIKMERLNGFGIRFLSDLMDPCKLKMLQTELHRVFDEILMGNIMANTEILNSKDKILFANGHNAGYWLQLMPNSAEYSNGRTDKNYKRAAKVYERKLKRFKMLLKKTGAYQTKEIVRNLMDVETSVFISQSSEYPITSEKSERTGNSYVVSAVQEISKDRGVNDQIQEEQQNKKTGVNDQAEQVQDGSDLYISKNTNSGVTDPLLYSVIYRQTLNIEDRYCCVTGLDIGMQKKDSIFLCTSGLKYYKRNQPEIWEELWLRLDPKWHTSSEDIQLKEIHHSIRNEYFNKIHNTRRSIEKVISQPALFDQMELISKEKLIIAGLNDLRC